MPSISARGLVGALALMCVWPTAASAQSTVDIGMATGEPASRAVGTFDEIAGVAPAAHPHPRRRARWPMTPPDPPDTELGFSYSAWTFADPDVGRALGVSYGRYLTREASIEGALDIGSARGEFFAMPSVQLRASPRDEEAPFSIVTGLAYAVAQDQRRAAPRGLGLLVGGGLQPRLATEFAFRLDIQLLRFSDHVSARLVVTLLKGRN